jgi:hypothetical protein
MSSNRDDLSEDLDIGGVNLKSCDSGNMLEVGWYPAVVDDVYRDEEKGPLNRKIVFKVTAGPRENVKQTITLGDPADAEDVKGADGAKTRRVAWAKRLGLVDPETPQGVTPRIDWAALIGKEVAFQVKQKREKNEKTGKWEVTDRTEIDFIGMGVYLAEDKRVPAELRKGSLTNGVLTGQLTGQAVGLQAATATAATQAVDPLAGL